MFVEVKIFVEDGEILAETTLQLILLWRRFQFWRVNTFHCFCLGQAVMTF